MRTILSITLAIAFAVQVVGCASYSKNCYPNGVCKIVNDGKVSWEGPPDKVAEMQAQEDAQKQRMAEIEKAYADAPKRGAEEPIRLAVVASANSGDISALVATYRKMIEEQFNGVPRIVLVPETQIKGIIGSAKSLEEVNESFAKSVRDTNPDVDIVLLAFCTEKTKTGFVGGGKGGGGLAQVANVEFRTSVSSVYQFAENKTAEVGDSTAGISVAGVNDKGKKGSGEIKAARNPEKDRAALEKVAAWAKTAITEKIAPTLPSTAALAELRKKYSAASDPAAQQMSDKLKNLFGPKN
jgi:hypothetical protein